MVRPTTITCELEEGRVRQNVVTWTGGKQLHRQGFSPYIRGGTYSRQQRVGYISSAVYNVVQPVFAPSSADLIAGKGHMKRDTHPASREKCRNVCVRVL